MSSINDPMMAHTFCLRCSWVWGCGGCFCFCFCCVGGGRGGWDSGCSGWSVTWKKKNRLVAKTKRIMNKFIKSKLLCGMYGFSVKSSVTWLNILRLLIRFCFFVHLLSNFKFKLNRKINKILAPFQQEHRRAVRRSKNPEGLVVMCWL